MSLVIRTIPIKAELFDVEKVVKNLEGALDRAGKRMTERFKKTTTSWSSAPDFKYEVEMSNKDASVWSGPVGSDDLIEKWRRLDEGVEPHPIPAKPGGWMTFNFQGRGYSYSSATKPRIFGSKQRAKYGPVQKFKLIKNHPGSEPREWSLAQAEIEAGFPSSQFCEEVQDAIDKGMA